MTPEEFKLLETVFLSLVVAFVGVALPGYALMRKYAPENGWNHGGNVSTSVIQPFDLLIVGFYLLIFAGFLKGAEMKVENPEKLTLSAGGVMASSITMLLIAGLVPAAVFWRGNLAEFFGLRWKAWPHVFWIMPAFVFVMMVIGALLVASGWQTWIQEQFNSGPQDAVKLVRESSDTGLLVAMAIAAIVIAPIAEELIFRGYLYPVVKRFTDQWFAAAFTGLFFGVIHFNLMAFPMLALMGVVLAVLYEKTGSLWVVIGCHAAFNATTVGLTLISRLIPSAATP